MHLDKALAAAAEFPVPETLEQFKKHIPAEWVEEALSWAGTATVRRRRLPAEQVVWLVIAMGLFRDRPIEDIVDTLDLAVPDKRETLVAKSAIAQARQRLTEDPLAYLFITTASEWAARSAESDRWRGLTLYGLDGTTLRVPDSPENREAFGGHAGGGRGESGYPLVRIVAMMAVRSHLLAAFRFADYHTGETTLARDIWQEVPENSLVLVDRGFLVKKDVIGLELSGNRHWLTRTKVNTKWSVLEKLGKDDYLVEWDVHETDLPSNWQIRAIHYKRKGYGRTTLLTSLIDPKKYPAKELVELYHERWETELGYDEMKTHLLSREETIRSRTPEGVRQELWGIALAYNLVRLEMEQTAREVGVPPTRLSFVTALRLIREELWWMSAPRLATGTIPKRLSRLRDRMKRLLLPPRRRDRAYPRAVKLKMSNYARKRPVTQSVK
jgi:transposase IS4-like protein/DDE family transposase